MTSAKYAGFLPVSVFDIPDLMASLRSWESGFTSAIRLLLDVPSLLRGVLAGQERGLKGMTSGSRKLDGFSKAWHNLNTNRAARLMSI
jgi:hypothetical protein